MIHIQTALRVETTICSGSSSMLFTRKNVHNAIVWLLLLLGHCPDNTHTHTLCCCCLLFYSLTLYDIFTPIGPPNQHACHCAAWLVYASLAIHMKKALPKHTDKCKAHTFKNKSYTFMYIDRHNHTRSAESSSRKHQPSSLAAHRRAHAASRRSHSTHTHTGQPRVVHYRDQHSVRASALFREWRVCRMTGDWYRKQSCPHDDDRAALYSKYARSVYSQATRA